MSTRLSSCSNGRDNNFNLLRVFGSLVVMFSHSFALVTGSIDSEPLHQRLGIMFGNLTLDMFFVTSGFLITRSYLDRRSILEYTYARVLRIYPALLLAIFLTVFVVGAMTTSLPTGDYFSSIETWKYLLRNSIVALGLKEDLPGVFETVPFPNRVNVSLWTLPHEVRLYAIVAVLLFCTGFLANRLRWIGYRSVFLFIGLVATAVLATSWFQHVVSPEALRLYALFFIGSAVYIWRDRIVLSAGWAWGGLALLLALSGNREAFHVAYALVFPYLVLCVVYLPGGFIRKFNGYGDYSYGMYIYAWPIQQLLIQRFPSLSPGELFVASVAATLPLAMLSWFLLEKKALRLKGHYVSAENYLARFGWAGARA